MASLNLVQLIGHAGRDAELKYSNTGTAIANFSVATTESTSDGREFTEWHAIKAFGKTAEVCGQYVRKGRRVYIQGKNQTQEWEKDNIKHKRTEVIAQRVVLLDKPPTETYSQQHYQPSAVEQQPMDKLGYKMPEGYISDESELGPPLDLGDLTPGD